MEMNRDLSPCPNNTQTHNWCCLFIFCYYSRFTEVSLSIYLTSRPLFVTFLCMRTVLTIDLHVEKLLRFSFFCLFVLFRFPLIFISWRLIMLQYCSGFCHTLTWISHGFTRIPHPNPPSCLCPHPMPLGLPSAPALSTYLMHPTWAGDLFHPW